ncbi:hypothetical protein K438DRAFT_1818471 [Mycena galopus ATCC 62051]|nr:hypothetical protein K438DRAFT_1818471 [Mycena galopus ATCC 62051]
MSSSPTNVAHIFGSAVLSSVETQVKVLIATAEANIERLTTQIRELTSIRERERSILATLRLMVVPIGKLPTELLVEIFKLAVDAPVVSPYWRQIIHNAPQLWAQGFVEINLSQKLNDRLGYMDGLQTLLARSNPLPISISLTRTARDPTRSESVQTIARMVTATAHRWKNLSVDMSSFDIQHESFAVLERLSMQDLSKQKDPVIAFQSSPRLRYFDFWSGSITVSPIHLLRLPWSQLTHLDIEDMSLGGCRAVLLQCTHLVSGKFTTFYAWDSVFPATESPVITLPRLQHLTLSFDGDMPDGVHGVQAFLLPLALPSLKTLEFSFGGHDGVTWPTQVVTLFQDRCPNIEEITFALSSIPTEGLIALLRNGRALTTLTVNYCWNCINAHFWDALQYDIADPTPLAPKLENLSLENVGDNFEDGMLEAAIRSRWWPDDVSDDPPPRISRLETVFVSRSDDGSEPFDEALRARMQDMVDQGLNLDLV